MKREDFDKKYGDCKVHFKYIQDGVILYARHYNTFSIRCYVSTSESIQYLGEDTNATNEVFTYIVVSGLGDKNFTVGHL